MSSTVGVAAVPTGRVAAAAAGLAAGSAPGRSGSGGGGGQVSEGVNCVQGGHAFPHCALAFVQLHGCAIPSCFLPRLRTRSDAAQLGAGAGGVAGLKFGKDLRHAGRLGQLAGVVGAGALHVHVQAAEEGNNTRCTLAHQVVSMCWMLQAAEKQIHAAQLRSCAGWEGATQGCCAPTPWPCTPGGSRATAAPLLPRSHR